MELVFFTNQTAALFVLSVVMLLVVTMGNSPMNVTSGGLRQQISEAISTYRIRRLIRAGMRTEKRVMAEITLIESRMDADGAKLRFLAHRLKSTACVTSLAKDYGLTQQEQPEWTIQRSKLTSLAS